MAALVFSMLVLGIIVIIMILVVYLIVDDKQKSKHYKQKLQQLKEKGQITAIRFKIKKFVFWSECGEIYVHDTHVRTLGDTQTVITSNKNEKLQATITEFNLCDLTNVQFTCVTENGEVFKRILNTENTEHLQLTFENGSTTVLF